MTSFDIRNKIIQARNATIDVEVRNLQSLLEEMKHLRKSFPSILQEAKHVATAMKIEPSFPVVREKRNSLPLEDDFKRNVFLVIIDSVISGLSARFKAANDINNTFRFLVLFRNGRV